MRNKGKLNYIRLLVPVLLVAGVQIFAQAAADSRMHVAGSASQKMMKPDADVVLISDRTFLMKDIKEIMMSQRFNSQSVGTGCSSSISAVKATKSVSSDRCPIIDCPAPPPGCSYGPPDTDPNGCPINCGQLVCGAEN
jgi:hypothetical protein